MALVRRRPHAEIPRSRQACFLVGGVIDQPILPFAFTSARIGELSEASPDRRRFIDTTSSSVTLSVRGDLLDLVGMQIAVVQRRDLALHLAQVEEQPLLAAVVPILTRLHERRTYSWIEARIHHMA